LVFDVVDQYLLDIEVWHQDLLGSDELLGSTQVSLLPTFRLGTTSQWAALKQKRANGGTTEEGNISITMSFVGPTAVAYPQLRPEVKKAVPYRRTLGRSLLPAPCTRLYTLVLTLPLLAHHTVPYHTTPHRTAQVTSFDDTDRKVNVQKDVQEKALKLLAQETGVELSAEAKREQEARIMEEAAADEEFSEGAWSRARAAPWSAARDISHACPPSPQLPQPRSAPRSHTSTWTTTTSSVPRRSSTS